MKLKQAFETETYVSDSGYYVIEQDDGEGGKDIVFLTRSQLLKVISDMKEKARFDLNISDTVIEYDLTQFEE
jgi:hypothetical protein